MTSYLQSLTSHYTSLKRLLPNTHSAESDRTITDVDDSHVTHVLRSYYTEKGRPFPPWLPPDPNAPQKATPALVGQSANSYGGFNQPPSSSGSSFRNSRGGGLDDLFSSGPANNAPPPREQPTSMRARRGLPSGPAQRLEPEITARPLPSQRHGSNQSRGGGYDRGAQGLSPGGGSDGGPISPTPSREQSAAERLKARIGGARTASPAAVTPPQQSAFDRPSTGGSRGGGYERSNGNSGGGYYDNSRGGGSSRTPYNAAPADRYGGGGGGGGSQAYTGASAPWSSGGDNGYGGGSGGGYGAAGNNKNAYGGDGGYGRRAPGLPSNPRRR